MSKFSKVSLFSGLNSLIDITLEPPYSTLCGYTEADLDTVFAPELPGLDRERIRDWYNGYNWGGAERVYNPFDALLLFRTREFRAWWFETGTPTFLVETLARRCIPSPSLDGMLATDELLSTFDVGNIATEALLFQTGYLTLLGREDRGGVRFYRLGYPNRELRQSLNKSLLGHLVKDCSRQARNSLRLYDLLEAADFGGLERLFHALFAGIPYEWHSPNEIADYEGYYASVFYSYFAGLGLEVTCHGSTVDRVRKFEVRGRGELPWHSPLAGGKTGMARCRQAWAGGGNRAGMATGAAVPGFRRVPAAPRAEFRSVAVR